MLRSFVDRWRYFCIVDLLKVCDTMGGIRFCGCGCQSENPFVCFGAKPTQRACARDLPRDRKMTWEGRSQRQSAGEGSQEKWTELTSLQKRTEQPTEVRKAAASTCGLRCQVSQREKMNQHSSVALWEFRSNTRSRLLTEAQNARKVSQNSPVLSLELT